MHHLWLGFAWLAAVLIIEVPLAAWLLTMQARAPLP